MTRFSDLSALARKFFDLELPCTPSELKKAYRRESKRLHPDSGGTDDTFRRMNEAYEILTSKPEILKSDTSDVPRTEEGIPLTSLGLGLKVNGVRCSDCEGKGYTTLEIKNPFLTCTTCSGSGIIITCPSCQGKGHKASSLTCRKCHGKGWLSVTSYSGWPVGLKSCHNCGGNGGFATKKTEYKHYKCGNCDGKGQREMFNPLLPKMRF